MTKEEINKEIKKQVTHEIDESDWKNLLLLKEAKSVITFATDLYYKCIDIHLFLEKLVLYTLTITKTNNSETIFLTRASEFEVDIFKMKPITQLLFQNILLEFFVNVLSGD